MKKFKNFTLAEYCAVLSAKAPVPGGGSAAALTGALGAALLAMVANYSVGRQKTLGEERKMRAALQKIKQLERKFLKCVDEDAQAYLKVVSARTQGAAAKQNAKKEAASVPQEVCGLCYQAVQCMDLLVRKGNPHLLSDVEVAMELLLAAYRSARINIAINQ
jgi:methenyltetrahydrofolate cyclohydrolase